ncbi:MAG: IS982 family transposase [Ktedonobacteraceae bacterium]|nr:IS982 family transposase [Ktedonobacteraceae bacterium]
MSILNLFCDVDDFWQTYAPEWEQHLLANGKRPRHHAEEMYPSEIMTILIHFPQSCYRTFKHYYLKYVQVALRQEFPRLLGYTRTVEVMADYLVPLTVFLPTKMGVCTGISFIDSTALAVCKNPRIASHRVFAGLAQRGKTTTGWFFGFKLHLVINDRGELVAFCLTPGNRDDRAPVPHLTHRLFGKLIADKGYLSQSLFERLFCDHGIQLMTRLRKNMPNALMDWADKCLLRKRAIIESVNDQLKNIRQIVHSRHRSPSNFLVNLVGGLIAYCFQPKKPSLGLDTRLGLTS